MVAAAVRTNPVLVVCLGQSLWGVPVAGTTVPQLIRDAGYSTYEPWEGGIAWVQWAKKYQGAIIPQANSATTTVLACMGGTTDIDVGATGAVTYNNLLTIADAAIAAGYDLLVNMTLTPSTTFNAGEETERLAFNSACLTNTGGRFDAVVDLAAAPELDDATDTTHYSDGTHWTQAGTNVAGVLIVAAIGALL